MYQIKQKNKSKKLEESGLFSRKSLLSFVIDNGDLLAEHTSDRITQTLELFYKLKHSSML